MDDTTHDILHPIIEEIERLFGPPPVLSSEDPAQYSQIVLELVQELQPTGFLGLLLIRQMADSIWIGGRLARYQHTLVDQQHHQQLLAEESHRAQDEVNRNIAVSPDLVQRIDHKLDRVVKDRQHVRALQQHHATYRWLDSARTIELKRRDDALELFERYQDSFESSPRPTSEQIIDAEFEVTNPSVAPSPPAAAEEDSAPVTAKLKGESE